LSLSGRDIICSVGLGFLNPFAYYFVLLQAYDLLPAQEAQPLNCTWAITLSLLSVPLLKQPLRFEIAPRRRAANQVLIFSFFLARILFSGICSPGWNGVFKNCPACFCPKI
jgi:hypothetical protein